MFRLITVFYGDIESEKATEVDDTLSRKAASVVSAVICTIQ